MSRYRTIEGCNYIEVDHFGRKRDAIRLKNELKEKTRGKASIRIIPYSDGYYGVYRRVGLGR